MTIRFLAVWGLFVVRPALATPPSHLAKKVTFTATPRGGLLSLCCALAIPCAIEVDGRSMGEDDPGISRDFKNTPGEVALITILKDYPGHSWRITDGILTISPRVAIKSNPLDKSVGPIDFRSEKIEVVESWIQRRPGLTNLGAGHWDHEKPSTKRVSYKSKHSTARELLTGIVKQYGDAAWIARHKNLEDMGSIADIDLVSYDNKTCFAASNSEPAPEK